MNRIRIVDQPPALPGPHDARAAARPRFGGVIAVTVTPCRDVGVVDPAALGRLCGALAARGCDGVFIAGSTGEAALLDEDDRRALTAAARRSVDAATQVYAGVSGLGLKQTLRYARNAACDGADVAVVMAPYFFKFTPLELESYLLAVADSSPIPIALYHHPRMPSSLEVETVVRLARHPNIVAIKDTSPDADRFQRLVELTAGADFSVLQGSEALLHQSLLADGAGMATALAGVVPEWHADLWRAARGPSGSIESNRATAAVAQHRIDGLWRMFQFDAVSASISAFSSALKLTLRRRGWIDCTAPLMPGFEADEAFQRLIDDHLTRVGLPADAPVHLRIDPPSEVPR